MNITSKSMLTSGILTAIIFVTSCSSLNHSNKQITVEKEFYYPPSSATEGVWDKLDPVALGWNMNALEQVFNYAKNHNSSGLVILKNGKILAQRKWQLDNPLAMYTVRYEDIWFHGTTPEGWAREDVASTQKSIISILAGIAWDKKLIDLDAKVSRYIGDGWSRASQAQENAITVRHLLSMSSGLTEKLEYSFPAGTNWAYINKAYSLANDVIQAASGKSANELTKQWLTEPLGMSDTKWITRIEFFRQWNMNGLVTTAPDLARLGLMIQSGGQWKGKNIVSKAYLEQAMSPSTEFNPSYGLLWWINNPKAYRWVRDKTITDNEKMIPDAPDHMLVAMGTSERRLYITKSSNLIISRTGSTYELEEGGKLKRSRPFDVELWRLLKLAMPTK